MIIYKAANKINGKVYIGQTVKGLSGRISDHIRDSKLPFGCALRKYGLQSFDISVIDSADSKEALNEKERYWIKTCDCKNPKGYNLTDGGEGNLGWSPSQEARKKMSDAHTPERRKKLSERVSGDNNPMKRPEVSDKVRDANIGRCPSEETRQRMSQAHLGIKQTEEWVQKKSESLMGHLVSAETREKLRQARLGRKASEEERAKRRQFKQSEESNAKRSETLTGIVRSEETKQKMRKPKSPEGRANIAEANRRRAILKQAQLVTLQ
jgi:group I intron endonuclease